MIIISGAGTGGHVLTALSVLEELKKLLPHEKFLFVGSYNLQKGKENEPSIEEVICKRYSVPFTKIRTGKVQRFIEMRTFKLLALIPIGFIDAIRLVSKIKPKAIIAFGGFTTPPLVFAGKLFGIPTFIHEQTTSVGLANKVASIWADHIIVAFKDVRRTFPARVRDKVVHLGYPVRRQVFEVKTYRQLIRRFPDLKQRLDVEYLEQLKKLEEVRKPILTVVTGGTGSLSILKVVLGALPDLSKRFHMVIQTGDLPVYAEFVDKAQKLRTRVKPIVTKFMYEELGYVLNKSSVVVSRSGAGFVYQLGMLQKRAVLIPLPFARGNEQYKNALILKRLGLAYILPQARLNEKTLIKAIEKVHKMRVKPQALEQAQKLFVPDAAEKIAQYIVGSLDIE